MTIRPLLLTLPLLLTGCSTLSNFSWSSLSPFNWFGGSSIEVTDSGVGGINASTPLNQDALEKALDGNYRLRSGMATNDGKIVSFYQAMTDKEVKLVITGQEKGTVQRVDVLDKNIGSEWGVKIGAPFSDLYTKAFGSCEKAQGDDADGVECKAPQSQRVSYIFSGIWHGPEGLMPSDDALKDWKVTKIVWRANASQ
jgi:hypothetical protein